MMNYFDSNGWLTETEIANRVTNITPPEHGAKVVGQLYPNFTGVEWVMAPYSEPVPQPPAPYVDPTEWLIDIGPLFDRFGAAKTAVLLSTEPVVMAFLKDLNSRHWANLQRVDLAAAISYMRGVTIPGLGTIGTPITGVTEALQTAILTTPLAPDENMVLRKLFFGG